MLSEPTVVPNSAWYSLKSTPASPLRLSWLNCCWASKSMAAWSSSGCKKIISSSLPSIPSWFLSDTANFSSINFKAVAITSLLFSMAKSPYNSSFITLPSLLASHRAISSRVFTSLSFSRRYRAKFRSSSRSRWPSWLLSTLFRAIVCSCVASPRRSRARRSSTGASSVTLCVTSSTCGCVFNPRRGFRDKNADDKLQEHTSTHKIAISNTRMLSCSQW
mmetsp:Transcript_28907/g.69487  ORF Transcript_28907/g.69487 Transcript_28907/m.69487 type:complete len:219 (+) Transcript_28907:358-1014(+)